MKNLCTLRHLMNTNTFFSDLKFIMNQILNFKFVKLFDELPKDEEYYQIVKNPICINDIIIKTKNNQYNSFQEYVEDFRLLCENTKMFRGDNSRDYVTTLIIQNIVCDLIEKVTNTEDLNTTEKLDLLIDFHRDIFSTTKEEITKIKDYLQNQNLTINDVLQFFHCSYPTFRERFKTLEIEYPILRANKKSKEISTRHIEYIQNLHKTWDVGYQTMCHYLQIPEWETRQIYTFLFSKNIDENKNDKKHTKRFFATEIHTIWHTDIHYLKKNKMQNSDKKYLVSFIDDCSRKILFSATCDQKNQLFVINSLLKCINQCGSKPYILTTDNGGEFCGELMEAVLKILNIKHWKTKPYTPQQNGKIERYWRGLEGLHTYADMDNYIRSYNEILPKRILRQFAHDYLHLNISLDQATPDFIYENTKKFESYHDGVIVEIDTEEEE